MHAKFYVLHDNPGQLYDNFQETGNPARSPPIYRKRGENRGKFLREKTLFQSKPPTPPAPPEGQRSAGP